MSQSDRYQLVARVASHSNPNKAYDIKWDGQQLTCPCRGWIMKARGVNAQGHRSCRHTDEVNLQLQIARMTAQQAANLLAQNGGLAMPLTGGPMPDPIKVEVDLLCRQFPVSSGLRLGIDTAIRKFAGKPTVAKPLAPTARPDWLGGGRAIILRD